MPLQLTPEQADVKIKVGPHKPYWRGVCRKEWNHGLWHGGSGGMARQGGWGQGDRLIRKCQFIVSSDLLISSGDNDAGGREGRTCARARFMGPEQRVACSFRESLSLFLWQIEDIVWKAKKNKYAEGWGHFQRCNQSWKGSVYLRGKDLEPDCREAQERCGDTLIKQRTQTPGWCSWRNYPGDKWRAFMKILNIIPEESFKLKIISSTHGLWLSQGSPLKGVLPSMPWLQPPLHPEDSPLSVSILLLSKKGKKKE